jgi:DNA segregation ATPase FtsK/SpoIIIE, S-DNA-T family
MNELFLLLILCVLVYVVYALSVNNKQLLEIKKEIEDLKSKNKGDTNDKSDEELYKEAKELVIRAGKASASFIQRRLRIGYARAARLIDMLEEEGVVGTEKQEEKKQK